MTSRTRMVDAQSGFDGILAGSSHVVQFYESEEFLHATVTKFIAEGLASGEPVVVIATPSHNEAFSRGLVSMGIVHGGAPHANPVTFLDAKETLASVMNGSMPDEHLFRANVGGVIRSSAGSSSGKRVRAFGEMVDLLWKDGNPEGAIRLEELWNDLAADHTFSLLCGYPMGSFYKEAHGHHFEEVCHLHARVVPAERFSHAPDDDTRAREISRLQQRAQSLEAEIEHSRELERGLLDALAARRHAEHALQRREAELKDFLENATIGLHWVGPDGTILWANDAELQLLGYSRDEYVGRHIAEFYDEPRVIEDILSRLGRNETIKDYEAALRAKDGSLRWVSINSNVLFEDGQFVHTRCFTRDITDRKRLEVAQQKANEEKEFLLEATTILNGPLEYEVRLREVANLVVPRLADWCMVDVAREDGGYDRSIVVHRNQAKAELAAQLQLTGLNPRKDDPVAEVLRAGRPLLAGSSSQPVLASFTNDEEHRQRIEALGLSSWMTVPMKLTDRVMGAITFVSAESGRSYSENDLPLALEFASRAAMAVENARMFEITVEANRCKDQFLATLSHELRTPLTAILGWSRLLTMGGLDAETSKTALQTIERSARTQTALIDDLLDLSRVVAGKLVMRSELVDLTGVVENTVETLRLAAESRGIHIDVELFSGSVAVLGDQTRLQQIALNLVSNAIKFSNQDGHVSISLGRDEQKVRLVVSDDGQGIAADFLPHVFEPFRQADGAITRSHGGLGLGLAIVKYLAELHGGSVRVTSPGEGKGATFTVELPLAAAHEGRRDSAASS